jgi:hypothetical protein
VASMVVEIVAEMLRLLTVSTSVCSTEMLTNIIIIRKYEEWRR